MANESDAPSSKDDDDVDIGEPDVKEVGFEDYVSSMLSVRPARLSNQEVEDPSSELARLSSDQAQKDRLRSKITNVFSSATQMTTSLVSSAARTSFEVTKTITNIQAMQQYNEKKEAEIEAAVQAMEEARQERLKKEATR